MPALSSRWQVLNIAGWWNKWKKMCYWVPNGPHIVFGQCYTQHIQNYLGLWTNRLQFNSMIKIHLKHSEFFLSHRQTDVLLSNTLSDTEEGAIPGEQKTVHSVHLRMGMIVDSPEGRSWRANDWSYSVFIQFWPNSSPRCEGSGLSSRFLNGDVFDALARDSLLWGLSVYCRMFSSIYAL